MHFPWDCGTPTVDMLTFKLLLKSIDVKDFYLNTPTPRSEYIRLKLSDLPDKVIHQYNLRGKLGKGDYIYTEIHRGIYRLP